ncbi:MAG: hypothetical protein ACK5P5_04660 [Pseudobdellovibrionaceae bacterium]
MKIYLSQFTRMGLLIGLNGFLTMNAFAQSSASMDWSTFNGVSVCASTKDSGQESGEIKFTTMRAKIEENKIKKVLMKKEVILDVGRVSEFELNGESLKIGNCMPLAVSQVSNGTNVRCLVTVNEERIDVYIHRYTNNVTGDLTQVVSVIDQLNQLTTFQLGTCVK